MGGQWAHPGTLHEGEPSVCLLFVRIGLSLQSELAEFGFYEMEPTVQEI